MNYTVTSATSAGIFQLYLNIPGGTSEGISLNVRGLLNLPILGGMSIWDGQAVDEYILSAPVEITKTYPAGLYNVTFSMFFFLLVMLMLIYGSALCRRLYNRTSLWWNLCFR